MFNKEQLVFNGVASAGQATRQWDYGNTAGDSLAAIQGASYFDTAGPGPTPARTQAPQGDNRLRVGDTIKCGNIGNSPAVVAIVAVTAIVALTGVVTAGTDLQFA